MNNIITISITLLLTSCSAVNRYQSFVEKNGIPTTPFECSSSKKVKTDTIVEITAKNVEECFMHDSEKILWIVFWVPYCGENSMEVSMANKFENKVNLAIISLIWDYENVNKDVAVNKHPVYYLDRTLPKHRVKSRREFLKQILGNNYTDEYLNASDLFIKNGKVIHHCYREGVSDDLLNHLTK